ncbi:TraR/DksA C4-type zinc finger protein [Paenibacillus xanthanilyticus]|uniref:TraR/DksA C4-type zinc finger protein n=1 Tax=Paenibacillus xanthanilyticus TaxID=1783531 RepID=A0ABV8K5F4_9BACL
MPNTKLTSSQLETLRRLLEEERERLNAHFEDEESENGLRGTNETESVGELSAYDNHPGDLGTETFERERDLAIDDNFRQKLAETEDALERLDSGEYGICAICRQPIPYERLEALPATTRCVTDASVGAEVGSGTDARPSVSQLNADEERTRQAARFDDAGAWERLEAYGNASDTVTTGNKRK